MTLYWLQSWNDGFILYRQDNHIFEIILYKNVFITSSKFKLTADRLKQNLIRLCISKYNIEIISPSRIQEIKLENL